MGRLMSDKFAFDIKDTDYVDSFPPVPEWMSDEALKTLNNGYLLAGESPRDMYYRIACTSARLLNRPEIMRDIFDILWKGYLGLATPVASNFGANRGLGISCFGSTISDNIPSIFSHLKEVAMMSKNGGGVAVSYSNLRPTGSPISGGGYATGIVPVAQQYDKCAGYVAQGGIRRGSLAHYLSIEHPDAYELMLAKDHLNGDPRKMIDGNIALTITDSFMKKVIEGDKQAAKLFGKALETNLKTGSPYFFFIDNVNKANPQAYLNHGLKVEHSNLCCLTGETLIITKQGLQSIKELVGQSVYIFDGINWVENSNFKSYGKAKVIELCLNNGQTFKCTANHRWPVLIEDGTADDKLTNDLKIGDYLCYASNVVKGNFSNLKITAINYLEEEEEVFCTNVPSTSYFSIEGNILSGNSEIALFTDEGHSFVCCLSSLNLAKWDEWINWRSTNTNKSVVELSIYLLDSVMEEFIKRAKTMVGMGRAVRSAEKGRALGLGTMGLAYLYQLKNLPFKSLEARALNIQIHKYIQEESHKASKQLAIEYGEPEWCVGTGMRNTHTNASAPTRTNSVISGAFSPGIEPNDSNAYTAKQAKGSFIRKNPLLKQLLIDKGIDTPETWDKIVEKNGSVLYLDELSINEKLVFLTAREIDQQELIRQAADRTPYIDQAQSLNRFVHPNIPLKQLSELVVKCWKHGVKSTYYTKSSSDKILNTVKNQALIISKDNCPYCVKAKELFKEYNIQYQEYDIKEVEHFPWKTVPQIWFEGHFIGGYDSLIQYTSKIGKVNTNLKSNNIIIKDIDDESKDCLACEA